MNAVAGLARAHSGRSDRDSPAAAEASRLLVSHISGLRRLALRLTADGAQADDLLQETCLRVLSGARVVTVSNFQAWSRTVMRHIFIDQVRSRARHSSVTQRSLERMPAPEPVERPAWDALGLEDVSSALADIPRPLRATWELWLEMGSYQEVARQLGIPPRTVGTRLVRTRRRLRQILEAG